MLPPAKQLQQVQQVQEPTEVEGRGYVSAGVGAVLGGEELDVPHDARRGCGRQRSGP
jgi:hypothetical protein